MARGGLGQLLLLLLRPLVPLKSSDLQTSDPPRARVIPALASGGPVFIYPHAFPSRYRRLPGAKSRRRSRNGTHPRGQTGTGGMINSRSRASASSHLCFGRYPALPRSPIKSFLVKISTTAARPMAPSSSSISSVAAVNTGIRADFHLGGRLVKLSIAANDVRLLFCTSVDWTQPDQVVLRPN